MLKKFISLLLAVCMLFSLSACGATETGSDSTNKSSESQTDKPSSTDKTTSTQSKDSQVSSNTEGSDRNDTSQTQASTHQSMSTSTTSQPTHQSVPSSTTSRPTHTHKYEDATCISPKKCSCGKTDGSMLGHNYSDATCISPKKCTRCGNTEGAALGHRYLNGVCSVCNDIDEEKYVEAQVNAADKAFTDYTKYNDALRIIKAALQKYPQNATLKLKKDYYQGFAPRYLSSMTPYDKTVWFKSLDNDKDIFGEVHTNCIVKDNSAQWAHATYDLSAKYNTFSAIAYPRFYEGEATDGYIKIYVDGECQYSNTNIPPNSRPFSISLDVTGAMDIKIEYNWDSTVGLAEARVQKTTK